MRANDLELARRVDWRFLLPDARIGNVTCLGPVAPALRSALERFALSVSDGSVSTDEIGTDDLVVMAGAPAGSLERAAELARPGGWVYVEASGRSRHRIEAALEQQGFEGVASRWHWPEFDRCSEIVPLDEPDAVRIALARRRASIRSRGKAVVAKLLLRLGQLDRAIPCVSVVGRRPGGAGAPVSFTSAFLATLDLDSLGVTGESPGLLVTPTFPTSRHVIALIAAAGSSTPRLVAKMPRLAEDRGGVEREADVLRQLETAFGGIETGAPHVVALEDVHGRPVFVETAIQGRSLNPRAVRSDPDGAISTVRTWLGRLPRAGPESDVFDRLLSRPLRTYADKLGARAEPLVARTLELTGPLQEGGFPLVFEHGDLSHPNLLVQEDGTLGVIDWELAEPRGLPLNDLSFFLAYVAAARARAESPAAQEDSFVRAFVGADAWAGRVIRDEAARRRVPEPLIEPLFVATWARDAVRFPERAGVTSQPEGGRPHAYWRLAVHHAGALGWV